MDAATSTGMEELSWCARCAGLAFLFFSVCVVALGAALFLARRWPWCSCHVCRSYLTGSWARDFTNLGDWYAHLLRCSPTGTVAVHVLGCTITANPANVEHMLHTRFDNFPKGKPFAAVLGDLLGGGIFNVAGSHDLLSRFMASEAHGTAVDDKYLRDIVVSFLLAGRDTVSSALTTIFMLLSKNPAVAAAMRAEAAGGEKTRTASKTTYEHLKSLHYTHAVLHENMRLFPPVQFDSKFCAADDVLPDGTYVTAGARVMYHPYAMGRMPRIWGDDCEKFRPERWLTGPGGTFMPESLYRYPVFQAGLRVCLGKELAVMEMKAVSVAVVKQFDVEVVGQKGAVPRFAPGLTASISGGLPVRVRRV
ncbi:unnamed protein product [Triticum turgidum subsp. durum]|uniref:Cytochrome P450 n=1 Tax=Triticum turgidum subsp. durum TaxID=4567 RepID=A0A9R0SCZ5_TRITD|nr:unnamed protein product [Triticum turgidum subsp. durum]